MTNKDPVAVDPRIFQEQTLAALDAHVQFLNQITAGNNTVAIALLETTLRGFKRMENRIFERQANELDAMVKHLHEGGHVQ